MPKLKVDDLVIFSYEGGKEIGRVTGINKSGIAVVSFVDERSSVVFRNVKDLYYIPSLEVAHFLDI